MKYRPLGKTGLVVSEVGFGAWGIGGRTAGQTSYGETDDRTSLAALRGALECGITFFDTSGAYGNGRSEELIGEAFDGVRRNVVLATKAGYESWDRPPDFSAVAVVASVERSLERLRTDYIDLLQLHNAPLYVLRDPEVLGVLERLIAKGMIRSWGVSAKSPGEALEALKVNDVPIVQANFNMMDVRAVTSGLFERVSSGQIGFIARTPLCFGFLSGTIGHDAKFPPGDHRSGWPVEQLGNWVDGASELLRAVSATPGESAVQAALRFCLAFAEVSSVIPGILTSREAAENAAASTLEPLPPRYVAEVLEINRNRRFFVKPARVS
jgi:aryl-alcohol dehydrogenase-like predicted oxidoreductase